MLVSIKNLGSLGLAISLLPKLPNLSKFSNLSDLLSERRSSAAITTN